MVDKSYFFFGGEGGIFRSSTHSLRCPKRSSGSRISSTAFDRCTNGASLHLPPAALGSIARDYAARVILGFRQAKKTSFCSSFLLAEKEGFLFCGKATAVTTVHRTVAKSRLSNPSLQTPYQTTKAPTMWVLLLLV
ncbi:MAG: hypothetical protein IJE90_03575 [Clostridia bacterium]|nr:hypothetical protein [Clostridia bacterium]